MIDETIYFTSSVNLENHPMNNVKYKLKRQYYLVLEHFVINQTDNKYVVSRLKQYRIHFLNNNEPIEEKETSMNGIVKAMINSKLQPWRTKYRYWIMCDAALILMNDDLINNVAEEIKNYLFSWQKHKFDILINAFIKDDTDTASIEFISELLLQYKKNRKFINKPMHRYIVTANMSAGKSTLINALIGKQLAKTSQEACTGNKCYLYNKPYEDDKIHLENGTSITYDAVQEELKSISWGVQSNIASYFREIGSVSRMCIIDTPGVNLATNPEHGRISRTALKEEHYERAIYVLNANKLGTDEERAHIKWMAENVPKDKVIFVLNKLDDFSIVDDDISASIDKVRQDLIEWGFENPIICPISAYFALLIKMKANGDSMTEDEQDEYSFYVKKFKKPAYDLSKYYVGIYEEDSDSEIFAMSKKCGLYGLEKILIGGI
jgi:predicted GTPase